MTTRRQEKMARIIRDIVSDCLSNHLNDPRISSLTSVTRVEVAADMRVANIYISAFGGKKTEEYLTFKAIEHARPRIQGFVAKSLDTRFCPVLRIHKDERFKKTLEILDMLEKLSKEAEKGKEKDKQVEK
jgi:ribosome-binding factor A